MSSLFMRDVFSWPLLCVMGVVLVQSGCGPKNRIETGKVTGKVESQGSPITSGRVVLSSEEIGVNQSANLTGDGTFQFSTPLPKGNYRVYLLPADQGDVPPGLPNEQPSGKLKNVPDKYQSERTSDLNVTVNQGENNLTLDLKP